MTFIDWHTLKIVGEAQGKTVFQFCAQYLYYIFEVMLVILIIIYGQKAIETLLKKESPIPFGGIILAMTWGAFHFVSRGAGLEIWNRISAMIFSVLSGVMYLRLNRKYLYIYLFIAIGYLEPVFIAGECWMGEDFSRQTRRFSAAILTYGKGNRRSMTGKRPDRQCSTVVNTGSYYSPHLSGSKERQKPVFRRVL